MADNVNSSLAVGDGPDFATKDIAGVHYPRNILTTPSGVDVTPLAEGGNVAVSNFPATQPVSIASMPSTPVTGAFWQATQPVSGPLTDAQLRLSAVPVSLTSTTITGSVAVTGTFWQATQPVSGSVTVNTISGFATEATLAARIPVNGQALMAASVPVTLASNQSALPVTGTFWQTTQPVSLTSTTITGTVAVTAPTITKGTQAANGFSVQQLKDGGRAIVNAATAIAGVTAVTTEALLTLNVSRDAAATAAVTTIAVTSGKRLRIVGVACGHISTAAAVISGRISLRMNPSGAVAATSPILCTLPMASGAALAQAGNQSVVMFPEAIELSGTMQCGLSQIFSVTTGTVWASLIAYEY